MCISEWLAKAFRGRLIGCAASLLVDGELIDPGVGVVSSEID